MSNSLLKSVASHVNYAKTMIRELCTKHLFRHGGVAYMDVGKGR